MRYSGIEVKCHFAGSNHPRNSAFHIPALEMPRHKIKESIVAFASDNSPPLHMAVTGRREKESPHFKLTASCAEVRLAESRPVRNARSF
jgi:hypothetical protein